LEEKEKFITRLKSEKHKFFDCLQTIWGLIEIKDEEKVKEYIEFLDQEFKNEVTSGDKKRIIESNLEPLRIEAEEANIDFDCQLNKGLKSIKCSLGRLVRIAFNLVENAIEIAQELNDNRKISIKGNKKNEQYIISVSISNTNKKEVDNKITNKKRINNLEIVKFLVDKAGGKFETKYIGNEMKFICLLPKK